MNTIPSSFPSGAVPSIHIQEAEDPSALFDTLSTDIYTFNNFSSGDVYACSRDLQPDFPNFFSNPSPELDDMPELSHLTTTNQPFLTGLGYSPPYSSILHENASIPPTDRGLSPTCLGSPIPSPASSFASSLSPSSFYDPLVLSDSESPVSPSPATPDQHFPWSSQTFSNQSSDSLVSQPPFIGSYPNDPVLPAGAIGPFPHRPRSSSASRREPVASKAMLEANSRRRRHPAQFRCEDCQQTFTALFSLKRHQQSHTGERPFACGIPGCTQRFYNSSDCKRHEKSRKRHKELMMQ